MGGGGSSLPSLANSSSSKPSMLGEANAVLSQYAFQHHTFTCQFSLITNSTHSINQRNKSSSMAICVCNWWTCKELQQSLYGRAIQAKGNGRKIIKMQQRIPHKVMDILIASDSLSHHSKSTTGKNPK